jgi:hypothetical protein
MTKSGLAQHQTASGNRAAVSSKDLFSWAVKVFLKERLNLIAVGEHHDQVDEFGLASPSARTVFPILSWQQLGFGKRSRH